MLEKYVIRLKNVIFLKSALYLVIIAVLCGLIPRFKEEYRYSLNMYRQDLEKHNEIAEKLRSIGLSEEKILGTRKVYETITRLSPQESCDRRIKIAKEIEALQQKYNLASKIFVDFSTSTFGGAQGRHSGAIIIKNYDLHLKYSTSNIENSLRLAKDAFSKMPENSIITSIEFDDKGTLDLRGISELAPNKIPEPVESGISMRIRAITSNIGKL